MRGSSILASLANAILLLVAIGAIAWEAIRRFGQPVSVPGNPVMLVAAIGVVINGATALLFMKGRERDLNIRGAFLHMAADAGVSAGVIVAGFAINVTGVQWIDPMVSLLIVRRYRNWHVGIASRFHQLVPGRRSDGYRCDRSGKILGGTARCDESA